MQPKGDPSNYSISSASQTKILEQISEARGFECKQESGNTHF